MPEFSFFQTTRTTMADPVTLVANVRAAVSDATADCFANDPTHYIATKATPWLPADVAACQSVIDACPTATPQSLVKAYLDAQPLVERARDLTILDQVNLIRSKLPTPLVAITVAQWINAVKAKVDALTP
jgi:hypothetical protein